MLLTQMLLLTLLLLQAGKCAGGKGMLKGGGLEMVMMWGGWEMGGQGQLEELSRVCPNFILKRSLD